MELQLCTNFESKLVNQSKAQCTHQPIPIKFSNSINSFMMPSAHWVHTMRLPIKIYAHTLVPTDPKLKEHLLNNKREWFLSLIRSEELSIYIRDSNAKTAHPSLLLLSRIQTKKQLIYYLMSCYTSMRRVTHIMSSRKPLSTR